MKKPLQFPMGLDINQNRTQVDSTFSTLHDITGVFYDESYSPIWTESLEKESDYVISKQGDKYHLVSNLGGAVLYKNDEALIAVNNNGFEKEKYTTAHDYFDISNNTEYGFDIDNSNRIVLNNHTSEPLFTSGLVLTGRCRRILNKTVAVVLYLYDDNTVKVTYMDDSGFTSTHDFGWRRNRYTVTSNHPTPTVNTAADSEKAMYEPIIFIGAYDTTVLVTIANNRGATIEPDKFFTDSFLVESDNTVIENGNIQFSTTSIPKVVPVEQVLTVHPVIITGQTYTETNCYTTDNATFYTEKDNTLAPLTFTTGYNPIQISSEPDANGWYAYKYQTYTLTYAVSMTETSASAPLCSLSVTIDFSNSSTPKQDTATVTAPDTYTYSYNGSTQPTGITYSGIITYQDTVGGQSTPATVNVPMERFNYAFTFTNDYTVTANTTAGVSPNVFSDEIDGTMYCLFDAANDCKTTASTGYTIPFKSHITGITQSGTIRTLAYAIDSPGDFNSTYPVYRAASFGLGQGWARFCGTWNTKTLTELASNTETVNCLDVFWDSALQRVKYGTGMNSSAKFRYQVTGTNTTLCQTANLLPTHMAGSRARIGNYNIVYINELPFAISYSPTTYEIGTLLSEWSDFSTEGYCKADGNAIYYKRNNGDWIKVWTRIGNDIKLIEDNYIVVNTTSYFNCWDIKKGKKKHYASDYANRMIAGVETVTGNTFFRGAINSSTTTITASAINANFLVTNDGISSVSVGALPYLRLNTGSESFIGSVVPTDSASDKIDVYYSDEGFTQAIYKYSYLVFRYGLIRSSNSQLQDIYYPVSENASTLFSPNIFTEYLETYSNKDLVLNGDLGYQLTYANNTTPILLFSTATQLENVQSIFVIQGQFYGIIDDKLYSLLYSNGVLVESDCIIDITGMKFVGSLPTIAYFYSKTNRSFYSFTGDANLTLLYSATNIHSVYNTWYDTSTQTIYIGTDKGLYVISSLSMTRLPFYNIEQMFFTNNGDFYIETEDKINHVSYYSMDAGCKPLRMIFETKLFGSRDKTNTNINKYQVTLINHGYTENDKIKWRVETLTDSGLIQVHEDEKEIKPSDWDVFNQHQFDITPNFTKGQGVAIIIDTPWAISNITTDVNSDNGTTVVKNNRFSI